MNCVPHGSRAIALGCAVILLSFAQPAEGQMGPELPSAAAPKSIGTSLYRPKSMASTEAPTPPPAVLTAKTINGAGFMLALLLLGVGLHRHYSKRITHEQHGLNIEILSRRALSSKHALLVIEVNGQRMLIGQTSESLSLLGQLETEANFPEAIGELLEQTGPDARRRSSMG